MLPRLGAVGAVVALSIARVCESWVMENIEDETIRLEKPGSYRRRAVPCQGIVELPQPSVSRFLFSEVLTRRRSADAFLPLLEEVLSDFLRRNAGSLRDLRLTEEGKHQRTVFV